jgi:hypothetical protein
MLVFGRQRQEDCEFQAILDYAARSCQRERERERERERRDLEESNIKNFQSSLIINLSRLINSVLCDSHNSKVDFNQITF